MDGKGKISLMIEKSISCQRESMWAAELIELATSFKRLGSTNEYFLAHYLTEHFWKKVWNQFLTSSSSDHALNHNFEQEVPQANLDRAMPSLQQAKNLLTLPGESKFCASI